MGEFQAPMQRWPALRYMLLICGKHRVGVPGRGHWQKEDGLDSGRGLVPAVSEMVTPVVA